MSNIGYRQLSVTAAVVLVVSGFILWRRNQSNQEIQKNKKRRSNNGDDAATKIEGKKSVIILGDIFLDINAMSSTLPTWGCDLVSKKAIEAMAGGSALNSATHLAGAFGTTTTVWSAIGNDFWGEVIRNHTKKLGITLKGKLDCAATAVCMVISGDTDRGFLTYRGPMETLSLGQNGLDEASIIESLSKKDHFHIAGYYNCPMLWDEPSGHILQLARSNGATTSLNCQYDTTGEWAHLTCVLPHADFVFLNRDEALAIAKTVRSTNNCIKDVETSAHWFLDGGVVVVIITLGAEGAIALVKESDDDRTLIQVGCHPNISSLPLVDTTGAGDAFISGFLYGFQAYCSDQEVHDGCIDVMVSNIDAVASSLRWGVATGCACVTQFGASSPISYDQVSQLLPGQDQVVYN